MPEATSTSNDAAATGQARNSGERSQKPQVVQWWFVIKSNNKTTLHLLNLLDSQTGATVMHILRDEYKRAKSTSYWHHTRPQIEEAVLSSVSISSP